MMYGILWLWDPKRCSFQPSQQWHFDLNWWYHSRIQVVPPVWIMKRWRTLVKKGKKGDGTWIYHNSLESCGVISISGFGPQFWLHLPRCPAILGSRIQTTAVVLGRPKGIRTSNDWGYMKIMKVNRSENIISQTAETSLARVRVVVPSLHAPTDLLADDRLVGEIMKLVHQTCSGRCLKKTCSKSSRVLKIALLLFLERLGGRRCGLPTFVGEYVLSSYQQIWGRESKIITASVASG